MTEVADAPGSTEAAELDKEYDARLQRVQASMAERSLAALVVSDPANIYYLSGYDAWSFYVPQCLLVPASGGVHFFGRAMDAAGAAAISALPPERVHGYPERLVQHPEEHPFDWITDRARSLGLVGDGPDTLVAVEADSHYFSARSYLALAAALPRSSLVDSRELVNWVRLVKSEHEVARLRIAGSIAEQAMRTALEAVVVGRRQCDVAAEIVAAQAKGTTAYGGDYPAIVPLMPTGASAGIPHLTWSESSFVSGEATTIELAGTYHRYHAPLARTIMLGNPPKRLADTAVVVAEGMEAALSALLPGATGHDVHAAFNTVIARHGLSKESRIGYSIGIGYPPDWGERTVSLRPKDSTVLRPGMAFHVILGMWMDGWGYELSEPVVVTTSGAERLAHLPHELTVRT
jgi:ectoine hydrolase